MSDEPMSPPAPLPPHRRFTWIEVLVVMAIIAVVVALLRSEPQWVADGTTREFPVRIFVFDVERGEPVADAEVAVITHGPLGGYSVESAEAAAKQFPPIQDHLSFVPASQKGRTNPQGIASLVVEVRTSSSDRHPQPRALPGRNWVVVSAPGFRGVVFPLGYEPVLTSELRERGGFLVPIGIMRDSAK